MQLERIEVETPKEKDTRITLWSEYKHPGIKTLSGVATYPSSFIVNFDPKERILKVINDQQEVVYWIACPEQIEFKQF